MNNKFKKFALLLGDIAVLHLSLFLTLMFRYGYDYIKVRWAEHWQHFGLIFIIWLLVLYIFNLYNLRLAADKVKFGRLSFNAIIISGLLSIAYFYLNPQTVITPKTNLAIFIVIFTLLFIGWRHLFNQTLRTYLPKNNVMLIAKESRVKKLLEFLSRKPQLGFHAAIVVSELLNQEELEAIIRNRSIKTIIVDSHLDNVQDWRQRLFNCLHFNLNITDLATFYEKVTGKVSLETITHTWFLDNFNEGDKKYFNRIKRVIDLILASIVFLISLPLWLIIILIIKTFSPGPIFFSQKRMGKNGYIFSILKFRTMKNNQVTKIGSYLRKTRLDELPQMINIIKNDMSFIGPRPEQPDIVAQLKKQIPFYQERLLVKPGVSGWDQISEDYHSSSYLDSFEKLQYDLFYIKNRSLYLDFSIFLKTISTVIGHKGR